jgi:hypothetical protein
MLAELLRLVCGGSFFGRPQDGVLAANGDTHRRLTYKYSSY